MAKAGVPLSPESFINNWNAEFPDYQLTPEDLRKTHMVMGALFQIFDRLGIDREAVLMPPTERDLNEHMQYYGDLIPIINTTRSINHLMAAAVPNWEKLSINVLLHPTIETSCSMLYMLLNLIMFYEERARYIAPYEEELFNVTHKVKALEENKIQLLDQLNDQALEKAKRADRVKLMQQEIQQLEEEMKSEEELRDQDKLQLETLKKENDVLEVLLEQKRATKEGLLAERDRKRALRVYDAEEIQANAAQAALSVQEADDKLNSLQSILTQKDNSLKILQQIVPNLETANNLLQEINKLKDYELGDLDFDSKEGELDMLSTELGELQVQEAELAARRADVAHARQTGRAKRQHERAQLESTLREAEEADKKRREITAKALQRTVEIKERTRKYEEQQRQLFEIIQKIPENYNNEIKLFEGALLQKMLEVKNEIEKKQRSVDTHSAD